jgi:coiled-coil domain-containing protein 55
MSNKGNEHLSYGLNKRIHNENIESKKQTSSSTAHFRRHRRRSNSSSSLEDDDDDLAAHQDASRKRSMAALAAATEKGEASMYDYDGLYETWQKKEEAKPTAGGETKKSRYVEKLLATAKNRKYQLESTWERKRAKELKEEELANQELYEGKEQFVTEAYRKRLQEQQRWQEIQELKEQQEKDVTQLDKAGFSGSSAALLRNVIHGKVNEESGITSNGPPKEDKSELFSVPASSLTTSKVETKSAVNNFMEGFLISEGEIPTQSNMPKVKNVQIDINDWKVERMKLLERREAKLTAARERYFARVNLAA